MNDKLRTALIVFFSLTFCISVFFAARIIIRGVREQGVFEELAKRVSFLQPVEKEPGATEQASSPGQTVPEGETDLEAPSKDEAPEIDEAARREAMLAINADYFGWITIKNTVIDYPVMYTPSHPQKYLNLDVYGGYAASGTPFVDEICAPDGDVFLIYGHNMNNGSMFASLLKYADEQYYREHPVIRFSTLYDEGKEYRIFGAFYSRDYPDGVSGFRYYNYTDLSSEDRFNEFIRQVAAAREYDTGVVPEFGDTVIMLSTCSYHITAGRFVVAAVCKDDTQ